TPDLYRHLVKGDLWFLIHYHPELDGEAFEIQNGSPIPFAILEDPQGSVVPIFSSEARVDEALRKGKVPPRKFAAATMPALQVLELLGNAGLRAIINKSCSTGSVTIPPDL